jgi:hypothetical protein
MFRDKDFNKKVRENLAALVEKLEQDSYLKINWAKFDKLVCHLGGHATGQLKNRFFSGNNDSSIDLYTLVCVCELLGVQLKDVIPLPEINCSPELFWDEDPGTETKAKYLRNDYYEGIYQCYYFAPMEMAENASCYESITQTQRIRHAELHILRKSGKTIATLREFYPEKNFEGTDLRKALSLSGEVKLLVHMNQIHMELTDDDGHRFMQIVFPYIHIATDLLYSQVGAVLSVSTEQTRFPALQKIMITRRKINLQEDGDVIRGVLSMNGNQILVRRDAFYELALHNPWVKEFERVAEDAGDKYFSFYEDELHIAFRKTPKSGAVEYGYFMKALMALRNISTSPAMYKVKEHARFNIFSKRLQLGEIPGKTSVDKATVATEQCDNRQDRMEENYTATALDMEY